MKAAVLTEFGTDLVMRDVPDPEPGPGEVLVKVAAAGVCHSDVHLRGGAFKDLPPSFPWIMGHENAGYIAQLGAGVTRLPIGAPVAVYGGWGCGLCHLCTSGDEQLCDRSLWAGLGAPGGYAEFLRVPSPRHLVPLGDLDPVLAAPLTDAGLTPYRAVKRVLPRITPGTTAVVIGAGGLGQFTIQYLKLLTAAKVIVLDTSSQKLEVARALGADVVFDASSPGIASEVAAAATRTGVAAVFDNVGSDQSLRLGMAVLGPRGALVQVGLAGGSAPFSYETLAIEAAVTYSWWGNRAELAEVVALAQAGLLTVAVDRYPLRAINEVFDRLEAGQVPGRAVLIP